MMPGKKIEGQAGDHGAGWKAGLFSSEADALVAEIIELGGEAELRRVFEQFRKELEPVLHQLRDRLLSVAMDRGFER
jgi:hypothetical protein